MFFLIFKLRSGIRHKSWIAARSRIFNTDSTNAEKQRHLLLYDYTFPAASNHFSSAVTLAFDDMKQERVTNGDISKVRKNAELILESMERGSFGGNIDDIERKMRLGSDDAWQFHTTRMDPNYSDIFCT